MEESWDVRIRERARHYREQNVAGSDQELWLRAKDDLWRETLACLRPLAENMNFMRENLDEGSEEGLRAAAVRGCEAMRFLLNESDLLRHVLPGEPNIAREAAAPALHIWHMQALAPQVAEYFEDDALFDDFLAVERRILVRSGLRPDFAADLCAALRQYRERTARSYSEQASSGKVRTELQSLLNSGIELACKVSEGIQASGRMLPKERTRFRRFGRGLWMTLGGGLIVTGNFAVAVIIGDILSHTSEALGAELFCQGVKDLVGQKEAVT